MTRDNETWVQNILVKQYGIEAFMPEVIGSILENGCKLADLNRVIARTRGLRSFPKAWRRVAGQQERFAKEAEEKGHLESAAMLYHRAAMYYGKAQLYFHQDSDKKLSMHADLVRCHEKVCQYAPYRMERVVLPFEDKNIYGVLHLPNIQEPVPAILLVPGMDMIKEDKPNPFENHYLQRGMAVLVMDGPGQGETRAKGLKVTLDNYQKAGSKMLDYLTSLPEVDSEKIGLLGISMGSYWGPLIAANDSRIKAVVGALGAYLEKDISFKSAQPGFRRNYMYMSGIYDEDEFDQMASQMTLANVVDQIKIPMLLACGEFDELCPPEQVERFFNMLDCPKEMWMFEDEFHPMGGVAPEFYPWAIDWLKDCLTRGVDPKLEKKIFFESRQ